jgi:UDP-N-acetylglucosamine/UDP-N-acetyl-alpha-D-glucosaminouronate 4-epimerase
LATATRRDFVHVDNVVQANILAAEVPAVAGRTFNVAAGEARSVNELVGALNRLVGRQLLPAYAAPRTGEIEHSVADIRRATEVLGYRPTVGFEDGLGMTVKSHERARTQAPADRSLLVR